MPAPTQLSDVIGALFDGQQQALSPTSDVVSTELVSQAAVAADTVVMADTWSLTVGSPSTWGTGLWGIGVWG